MGLQDRILEKQSENCRLVFARLDNPFLLLHPVLVAQKIRRANVFELQEFKNTSDLSANVKKQSTVAGIGNK